MTASPVFRPTFVEERVALLEEHLGVTPEVTRLPTGWCVTASSPRVVVTCEWRRPSPRADWRYTSTLTVDGKRREIAESIDEFVKIWNEPGSVGQPRDLRLFKDGSERPDYTPPPLGPVPADTPIPPLVETAYRKNLATLSDDATLTLGYQGDHWQMLTNLVSPDGHRIEVYDEYRPAPGGDYIHGRLISHAAVNGKDYSAELAGGLDALLASLMSSGAPEKTAGQPIGTPGSGARSNSVEVRKGTVIRT